MRVLVVFSLCLLGSTARSADVAPALVPSKSPPPLPAAGSEPPRSNAAVLFSIRTPISVRDVPGSDEVEVDFSKADLELRLWKVLDTYNFEAVIDARAVNQAILPTDDSGRLLPEAKAMHERPFIRFYAPGKNPETIDVQCTAKECRALWKKVAFDAVKAQNFQIESNIRGLTGRRWTAGYNQLHVQGTPVFEFPPEKNGPARTSYFNLETFYWPEDARNSLSRGDARLRAIDEWRYADGNQDAPSKFRRIERLTRFAVIEGRFRVDVAGPEFLERREIKTGDVLWLFPGQIVSLTNYGPPYKTARVIRAEFERK